MTPGQEFFNEWVGEVGDTELLREAAACIDVEVKKARTWSFIESAPKDRFILVYCPEDDSRWLAKWQGDQWHGVDELGLTRSAGGPDYVTGWKVTHWMPLPQAPKV